MGIQKETLDYEREDWLGDLLAISPELRPQLRHVHLALQAIEELGRVRQMISPIAIRPSGA